VDRWNRESIKPCPVRSCMSSILRWPVREVRCDWGYRWLAVRRAKNGRTKEGWSTLTKGPWSSSLLKTPPPPSWLFLPCSYLSAGRTRVAHGAVIDLGSTSTDARGLKSVRGQSPTNVYVASALFPFHITSLRSTSLVSRPLLSSLCCRTCEHSLASFKMHQEIHFVRRRYRLIPLSCPAPLTCLSVCLP
jgi:hypothetical protein